MSEGLIDWVVEGLRDLGLGEGLGEGGIEGLGDWGGDWGILGEREEEWNGMKSDLAILTDKYNKTSYTNDKVNELR